MNFSSVSLSRLVATAFLFSASLSFAATNSSSVIPDVAASEVAQAFERLATENNQRVAATLNATIAALANESSETVAVLAARPGDSAAGLRIAHGLHRNRANRSQG